MPQQKTLQGSAQMRNSVEPDQATKPQALPHPLPTLLGMGAGGHEWQAITAGLGQTEDGTARVRRFFKQVRRYILASCIRQAESKDPNLHVKGPTTDVESTYPI